MIFEFDDENIKAAKIAYLVEELYVNQEPYGIDDFIISAFVALHIDRFVTLHNEQRLFLEQLEAATGEPVTYREWLTEYDDLYELRGALENYLTSYLDMEEQAKAITLADSFNYLIDLYKRPFKNRELVDMLITFTKERLAEVEVSIADRVSPRGPTNIQKRDRAVLQTLLGWLHEVRQ
jgi:hypothetical protein